MLREELVSSWRELKNQLQKVCLSPQEKEYFSQLASSKTLNFSCSKNKNADLDELEREIRQERESENPDIDNNLLFNLDFGCFQHSETILDWIRLKRMENYHRRRLEQIIKDEDVTIEEVD